MNKLNVTKGDWVADTNNGCKTIKCDGTDICDTVGLLRERNDLANAQLIADAGTTYNKCGLKPSELLEQRNELLEALEILMSNSQVRKCISGYFQETKALEVINKAKRNEHTI